MGFLHPGALYFFALAPALLIAYLVRERPRRVVVSSVLAFRALRARRGQRVGGWPRPDWMFFVELLILSLSVLAMAGPYVARAGNPVAVVLDDSAAMQAVTQAGRTRFDRARDAAADALEKISGPGEVNVYLTSPQPHRLGPAFATASDAVTAIEGLRATDAPTDPAALTTLLSQLGADQRLRRVIYAGARQIASPVPPRIEAFAVGEPQPNFAIGSFVLRREALGQSTLHARLTVGNFSPQAETLQVAIAGDGHSVARATAHLEPGQVGALEFPSLTPARVYRADLKPGDGLALDNVAYATAGAVKSISILFVTPAPDDSRGLDTLPGVAVRTLSPANFTLRALADADLAIFEYAVPKEIPAVNALLVMPPPGDPVFDFTAEPASSLQVTGWPPTSPLTDSVNFRLLNLRAGEYFGLHPWLQPIVTGNAGALMMAGERAGHRFVALGFNPFPYLGKQNLPMSVLTLNCLSYLAGFGAQTSGYHTGEPWIVPAGVETIVLPDGHKLRVTPGMLFTQTDKQGVYQLVASDGATSLRAVNLADLGVSDLESAPALKLEASGAGGVTEVAPRAIPITNQLLLAIVALAILEALVAYRWRRQVAAI
jgi:Aerotolerance regulator N-terminal